MFEPDSEVLYVVRGRVFIVLVPLLLYELRLIVVFGFTPVAFLELAVRTTSCPFTTLVYVLTGFEVLLTDLEPLLFAALVCELTLDPLPFIVVYGLALLLLYPPPEVDAAVLVLPVRLVVLLFKLRRLLSL